LGKKNHVEEESSHGNFIDVCKGDRRRDRKTEGQKGQTNAEGGGATSGA